VAATPCARRHDRDAPRRRHNRWLRASGRRRTVLGGITYPDGGVCPDKTRLIEFCRNAASDRGHGELANRRLRLPGLHPYLLTIETGGLSAGPPYATGPENGKAPGDQGRPPATLPPGKAEQGDWLGTVVRGSFAYHAVPTNTHALSSFYRVLDLWRRALRRPNQRDRTWKSMGKLADRWLPKPGYPTHGQLSASASNTRDWRSHGTTGEER